MVSIQVISEVCIHF